MPRKSSGCGCSGTPTTTLKKSEATWKDWITHLFPKSESAKKQSTPAQKKKTPAAPVAQKKKSETPVVKKKTTTTSVKPKK